MSVIKRLQKYIHDWSVSKGWWDDPGRKDRRLELLMLVNTELCEAVEEARIGKIETYEDDNGKPCGFNSEIADVQIRLFDLYEVWGIDIEDEIARKMAYNEKRPYRHGGKLY